MNMRGALRRPSRSLRHGVTLIELMVGLGIAAVLLAVAIPSMNEFIARKRVVGTADELATDLRMARSAAAQTNGWVNVLFRSNASRTCYTVYDLGRFEICDCRETPACPAGTREIKVLDLPTAAGLSVAPATGSPALIRFEPRGGLDTFDLVAGVATVAGTIVVDVQSSRGGHLQVRTNATGQPRICSVTGHANSYPACP